MPRVFALAGYVSRGVRWDQRFTPRWNRCLKREGITGGYHATDAEWPFHHVYAQVWRPKKDAPEETQADIDQAKTQAVAFKQKLVGIIEDSVAFGVGTAVPLANMEDESISLAYRFCVKMCLEEMLEEISECADIPPDMPILLVFEDGDGVEGEVRPFLKKMRAKQPGFDRFDCGNFADKLSFPPLQSADMIAFEVRKRAEAKLTGGLHGRRKLSIELAMKIPTKAALYDEQAFREINRAFASR